MTEAKKYTVKGYVQGVGYRYYTEKQAKIIGVCGYVRNLYDGSVEVYAAGNPEQLNALKQALQRGPSYSRVESVEEETSEVDSRYASFTIK